MRCVWPHRVCHTRAGPARSGAFVAAGMSPPGPARCGAFSGTRPHTTEVAHLRPGWWIGGVAAQLTEVERCRVTHRELRPDVRACKEESRLRRVDEHACKSAGRGCLSPAAPRLSLASPQGRHPPSHTRARADQCWVRAAGGGGSVRQGRARLRCVCVGGAEEEARLIDAARQMSLVAAADEAAGQASADPATANAVRRPVRMRACARARVGEVG